MKKWLGAARFIYNHVVADFRNRQAQDPWHNLNHYRELVKANKKDGNIWAWMREVPYNVVDQSIREAIENRTKVMKRNNEARAQGLCANHRLSFKRKKGLTGTISIRAQNLTENLRFYVDRLHSAYDRDNPTHLYPGHPEHRRTNHGWPNTEGTVDCDSTLTFNRLQRKWTFNWVYTKPRPGSALGHENQVAVAMSPQHHEPSSSTPVRLPLHVVAMDPGVRTFQTWFSPSKGWGEFGGKRPNPTPTLPHRVRRRLKHLHPKDPIRTDSDHLFRIGMFLDKLISKTSKAPSSRKVNMKRAQARARDRIKWKVKELHCKATKFFCTEFDVIVLPEFGGGRMSRKTGRKIGSKTVRQMLTWNHYRFRKRIVNKAEELGKVVIHPSEAYTTKTCHKCGWLHQTIGGSKVFRCGGCGMKTGRDLNAAINIFLRASAEGHFSIC